MRLLNYDEHGELGIINFDDSAIPPYAILSHTWGADADEVTLADLVSGDGKAKRGYEKIRFCGQQAQQHGLQYFWIDTCCIDKTDKAELSHAIRSMFRWYQNATRCYVYLSDVSTRKMKVSTMLTGFTWEPAFRASRWFTRGWTLQELLAPSTVEFFSQEWEGLGDKTSLKSLIHKITGISHEGLDGAPLSQFSVNERLRWKEGRMTKYEEDGAYSLLGIFNVELAPVYGEGAAGAFRRLMDEIHKLERCVQDLRSTDPHDDKKRIEETKGGLLSDSYCWVLDNTAFQLWQRDQHSRLLWIKGDAGKGKTMLLCGIINELKKSTNDLSFFFCQGTDSRINSATAVLRGLMYLLVRQQPWLTSHLRKRYDHVGGSLFQDANAWVALSEVFTSMVQDKGLKTSCLVVDALDECVVDLPKLLDLIVRTTASSTRVKWLVSSRNEDHIEHKLKSISDEAQLSLELKQNAEQVARAVDAYIDHRLACLESLRENDLREQLRNELRRKANGTFLWVALVMQELEKPESWDLLAIVEEAPAGLHQLYDRMMDQIQRLSTRNADICRSLLCTAAIAYRPLYLAEMGSLRGLSGRATVLPETVRKIVAMCGSFLTIRDEQVYLVHQSAKDYLSNKMRAAALPSQSEMHYDLFNQSLELMFRTLKRDMYNLVEIGISIEEAEVPDSDTLATTRYSCVYWVDHLCDSKPKSWADSVGDRKVIDAVDEFIRKKYLYWLEGLSLCRSMGKGVVSMAKLCSLVKETRDADELTNLVQDAYRFIMYHKAAVESYPLQAYASALLFSPTGSSIRGLFRHEEPKGIIIKPAMSSGWSACLQTLEGHSQRVTFVAFSHDSTKLASASWDNTVKLWDKLASASWDNTVKLWDTSSGACLKTFTGHSNRVMSVAFSHNSTKLASVSLDNTVKVWDASSGACLQTFTGHSSYVISVAFSHDSLRLASALDGTIVELWDANSAECLQTFTGHSSDVTFVAFSHDLTKLASASWDKTVKLWDASSGECLQTFTGHSSRIRSVAFSHDSTKLGSASDDKTVKLWDARSGECLQTFRDHSSYVSSVAFSHDSTMLASASHDKTVKLWDASSRACLQTFPGHRNIIRSIIFSHDSTKLASASEEKTVKLWDASSGACLQTFTGHSSYVISVAFSHDSLRLASASWDDTVKLWDLSSGECLQTFTGHRGIIRSVAFSHDSTKLASASLDKTVKLWDASSGACLQTFTGHRDYIKSIVFSYDSTKLALTLDDKSVQVWNASSGECLQTFTGHSDWVRSVAFSHDSTKLASASLDKTVKLWDASSGACLQTFNIGRALDTLSFDSSSSCLCTDVGTIAIHSSGTSNERGVTEPEHPLYLGTGLSPDKTWIKHDGMNILWIPSEYRPSCSAVCGATVSMGVGSGRLWLCTVGLTDVRIYP
ncbi:beta transducin-like protein HET-D2Y [Macroventuria anomochaeta]|uniref:Beta transducin-like protein HET-D2Y n=1 Tax=Macroventuria anomochaeta TaxID=301207 RepID=A0ACB6RVU7_9PLEO|nr:beta transducin-like protein HET-D2Y [Macroventuria anomochaeta]KAF2626135.1 beta transducin-like protein HET-D2Y [Macroventuria anomochaeta]